MRLMDMGSEICRLKNENAKLRAALERLEWSKRAAFSDVMECPVCFEWQRFGEHKPDCFMAEALGRQSALRQSEGE